MRAACTSTACRGVERTLPELASVLAGAEFRWWLAGGWALDAFLGRITRDHEDTDALILRRDHMDARRLLAAWDVHAVDPPGVLRAWPLDEELPSTVHDVWVRLSPDGPWLFQLMIDEADGDDWVFRRDPRIRRPLASLDGSAAAECRVLAPEIQLLYKSKALRPKDEADFEAVLPMLDATRRRWLRTALEIVAPTHGWLRAL